jgi:DMSO/TMAO reductase YedYZ molybdopterin-dependent catalytic subunit
MAQNLMSVPARPWRAGLAGLVAAGAFFAVAEAASAFFGPGSSPLVAVGGTVIDFAPSWLKDIAIAVFGVYDKLALFVAMVVAAAALAAWAGKLARRRWVLAAGLVLGLAAVIGACVLTRTAAAPADIVPTVLGAVAGLAALRWLTPHAEAAAEQPHGPARRAFLVTAAVVAVGAVVLAAGGRVLSSARNAARTAREALGLPAPKEPAPPLPAGVDAPVEGMPPFVTSNESFYRIDTALVVPRVEPSEWRLSVHGMVDRELALTFDDLLAMDLVEAYATLTCVSNEVGGNLAGNARWLGVPLRTVLEQAGPLPDADMVLSTSSDGFSASTPLEVLVDGRNALLAVGMNGEPLPLEHGFPVRMVVPGLYGYVSATKWVVDLEITRFADAAAYWTVRGWSERGPVKTASRIDVPRHNARVPAGTVALGGTAWVQHRGIRSVQVSIDDGPWADAVLAAEANVDTWRQWSYQWEGASSGTHTARVRAVDGRGVEQTGQERPPVPDGATGWHRVEFRVE